MRCAHCQHEFPPEQRRWRSKAWCSAACRRAMTREVRQITMWVERWGAAIHDPDLEAHADELRQRFLTASLHPPLAPPRAPSRVFDYVDLGDLPLDEIRR